MATPKLGQFLFIILAKNDYHIWNLHKILGKIDILHVEKYWFEAEKIANLVWGQRSRKLGQISYNLKLYMAAIR